MRAITTLLFSFSLLLSVSGSVFAQPSEVTAVVDKNPVMVDESFNLTITANDDVDRSAFDPSVLMQDFVVGRTSVSSQTQMINFNTTRTTIWSTVLIPRKPGRFTIPAFTVDGQQTQPIALMVVPVSAANSGQSRDIYITTELDVDQAYLQQQLRYTVKLYLAKDLQRGSLANPTLVNADIRQIGKDKEYNEIVEGRRYRIIERNFAIIPQQSGTFTIEGPLFEGEVVDNSRQSFGFFNRSTPVNRVGPNQQINILPIPTNYAQHWLPSDFVQLNEEWQGDTSQYHVGEPITRTLTLTAIGVVEEQLPAINSQYPANVKTYPDQAESTTVEKDNTLVAQRKESVAIIPGEAGTLVIPEVRIPWFNILTKKTEYTVLPEKTLQILPALNQATPPLPTLPVQNTGLAPSTQTSKSTDLVIAPNQATDKIWLWISAVLGMLWLLTLALWYWHSRKYKTVSPKTASSTMRTASSISEQHKQLTNALANSDSRVIQTLLPVVLADLCGKPGLSLSQALHVLQDESLTQEVNRMLAAQYSSTPKEWNAKQLATLLQVHLSKTNSKQNQALQLKPLYPSKT
ncbi:BatD family protein [Paraglaciecola hydrolytica]|uniref:Aerotolerance regulator BatD n=1 Tax=Paraglaciecola hydrolytica TaxID=1799789 RepID=A0A136A415_9ALTE|nr:BatD family protein [Paraglaciecola hydrolytica]KXI29957.1 aerotolerance regulator BatD [Paraglaciecola hydrolytica]